VIDLHCHLLPGLDDGASDIHVSLDMAKASVEQGVTILACTPHILPGLYHNTGPAIRQATAKLQKVLNSQRIQLRLVTGADVHMCPDFVEGLRAGRLLTINDSRYVLVEPPHHTAPPQMEDFFFKILVAGYVPILTHPERLTWVSSRYDTIKRLVGAGVWMQITAGSITGAFGRAPLELAQRMLDEGCVHIVASDAHDAERRPPDLAAAREVLTRRLGAEETQHLVHTRPLGVLKDREPSSLPGPLGMANVESDIHPEELHEIRRRGQATAGRSAGYGQRGFVGRLRQLFG
jgi:protein-tyrosine phosphatase